MSAEPIQLAKSGILLENEKYYHIYNRANGNENLFRVKDDYLRFLKLYERHIPPVADTLAWVLMANHFHLVVRIKSERYYKYSRPKDGGKVILRGAPITPSPNDLPNDLPSADRSPFPGEAVSFEDVKWETEDDETYVAPNHLSSSDLSSPDLSASEGPESVRKKEREREKERNRKSANPTNHFSNLFNAYTKYVNLKHSRTGNLFQRSFKRKPIDSEDYLRQAIIYVHQNPVKHGFVPLLHDYHWTSYHDYINPNTYSNAIKSTLFELFDDIENFIAVHQSHTDFGDFEAF